MAFSDRSRKVNTRVTLWNIRTSWYVADAVSLPFRVQPIQKDLRPVHLVLTHKVCITVVTFRTKSVTIRLVRIKFVCVRPYLNPAHHIIYSSCLKLTLLVAHRQHIRTLWVLPWYQRGPCASGYEGRTKPWCLLGWAGEPAKRWRPSSYQTRESKLIHYFFSAISWYLIVGTSSKTAIKTGRMFPISFDDQQQKPGSASTAGICDKLVFPQFFVFALWHPCLSPVGDYRLVEPNNMFGYADRGLSLRGSFHLDSGGQTEML